MTKLKLYALLNIAIASFMVTCFTIWYTMKCRQTLQAVHRPVPCTRHCASEKPTTFGGMTYSCQSVDEKILQNAPKTKYGIPLIYHQVYRDSKVPRQYIPLIRSCRFVNPDFIHVLWTDDKAHKLLHKFYSYNEDVYKTYKIGIERADFFRALILYHFGGVYADMDVECIKPLSQHLDSFKSGAILDMERRLQSRILWYRNFTVMNSVMIARPKHPFFKFMLDRFRLTIKEVFILKKTGPFALHDRFDEYMKQKSLKPADRVVVAEPKYFSPKLDPDSLVIFNSKCPTGFKHTNKMLRLGCAEWDKIGRRSEKITAMRKHAILLHQFLHLGYPVLYGRIKERQDACRIIPNLFKFNI